MKQRLAFALLLSAIGIVWLMGGGMLSQAIGQQKGSEAGGKQVGVEEARKIAAAFAAASVGEERTAKMVYLGRFLRKTFPPFRMCHRFEIPSPVESLPLAVRVWIDEETGMVVILWTDSGYPEAKYKYRGWERPKESELISEAEAMEIAKKVLTLARIPMEGMRLESIKLHRPQREDRYYEYLIVWVKFVQIKGIGEVEFPTEVLMSVDALTGELDDFLFKEFPVILSLSPPKISKEKAIELAKKVCKLQGIYGAKAHLKIEVPVEPNWDNPREVELWADDPPRFYKEFGLKRQALVWWVRLKGKYTYPYIAPGRVPEPKDAEWMGVVDAMTGEVEGRGLIPKD